MTEKTLATVIESCKALQEKRAVIFEETAAVTSKIAELQRNLEQLQKSRDDLEKVQANAPNLLITGKLSDQDFSQNKNKLSALYSKIDDLSDLLDVYEKALERDYPQRLAELDRAMNGQMTLLRGKIAEKLAIEIATVALEPIKQLTAVLSANGAMYIGHNVFVDLGQSIAGAIYGPSGIPSGEENTRIMKSIFAELGV
jgi:tetratricopeptide (TPR) repeat protein